MPLLKQPQVCNKTGMRKLAFFPMLRPVHAANDISGMPCTAPPAGLLPPQPLAPAPASPLAGWLAAYRSEFAQWAERHAAAVFLGHSWPPPPSLLGLPGVATGTPRTTFDFESERQVLRNREAADRKMRRVSAGASPDQSARACVCQCVGGNVSVC
jgi:hypothetical protein